MADANHNYKELDKLIKYVNANGSIEMLYSTPATYIAAKYAENVSYPLRLDDAMPYGTGNHDYWSADIAPCTTKRKLVQTVWPLV